MSSHASGKKVERMTTLPHEQGPNRSLMSTENLAEHLSHAPRIGLSRILDV
jgi:hypothetical protein